MSSDRLRVLHLFANFKWTGPADPAIRTAVNLRRLGIDVVFAQAKWTIPGAEHRMRTELARVGMPVIADMELRKHFQVRSCLSDARVLRRRLQRGDIDVLHTHLLADHLIAALARRRAPGPVTIVRSLYDPVAPRRGWRELLSMRATDGVIAPTRAVAARVAERFHLSPDRVLFEEPPIEAPPAIDTDLRADLGLDPGDFAIGITARIQPHRRFDLLWDTARQVVDRHSNARFVLLGRGNPTDVRKLVREPIERLGLQAAVRLPGYLMSPDYDRALQALDAFVFLVPGSDGTCRAVREAMARGLPVVATPRGILPELLGVKGEDLPGAPYGVIADEDARALADALVGLIEDPQRRAALGAAAAERAATAMDPVAAARRLVEFYRALMERRR